MNDLDALLAAVVEQARSIGLPVSRRIEPRVAVNRRAVTRLGCCRRTAEGFRIEVAEGLLRAPEAACLETLAHEVLHTCPGCSNHGALWRAYAGRLNEAWGYHIARTGSRAELGVEPQGEAKYLLVCDRCGQRFERFRQSPLERHPERYRCRCGGGLRRER